MVTQYNRFIVNARDIAIFKHSVRSKQVRISTATYSANLRSRLRLNTISRFILHPTLIFLPYLVIIKVAGVRLPAHLVWCLSSGVLAEVATLFIYSLSIMRLTLSRSSSSVSQQVNRTNSPRQNRRGLLVCLSTYKIQLIFERFLQHSRKINTCSLRLIIKP